VVRPKDFQDNATPSGNALAARALLMLDAYEENGAWRDLAEQMLAQMQGYAAQYPMAFAFWLQGMDFATGPVHQVAIVAHARDEAWDQMLAAVRGGYRPRVVSAAATLPLAPEAPALLHDRPLKASTATAYVCRNFACELPVTTVAELSAQLPQPLRSGQ
jgi:uncharacterized protein YyaL (SSP411 family)